MGGGLEARNPGSLSVKVHHFTLASKRGDSERGFALILDSEGRTAALSRAGVWFTFYNFAASTDRGAFAPAVAAGISDRVWALRELLS